MHHGKSDKQCFVKKPVEEDSNNNRSEDKDLSQVYQEIESDDNVKTHHLKQAHNAKIKQRLAHDAQKSA